MTVVNAILLVGLPVAVLLGGGQLMDQLVGRQYVKDQLREANAKDRVSLNLRYRGYDLAGVQRHWGALDQKALAIERRFLQFDLVFPFLYGAALAGALLVAWAALGRPFNPAWLISAVVITVLADWTENLTQLSQLQIYLANDRSGLQAGWIQIASAATVLKLVFFFGTWLWLACIAIRAARA